MAQHRAPAEPLTFADLPPELRKKIASYYKRAALQLQKDKTDVALAASEEVERMHGGAPRNALEEQTESIFNRRYFREYTRQRRVKEKRIPVVKKILKDKKITRAPR